MNAIILASEVRRQSRVRPAAARELVNQDTQPKLCDGGIEPVAK